MALFATPDQVRAAETQARTQGGVDNTGAFFNLGAELGNALQRGAFGTDTRSQAVRDAQFITQTVAGVDFNQPDTIVNAANELNQAGFTEQAFKFLSAVPPSKKPPEVWSEPYDEIVQIDGQRKKVRVQKNQYGNVRKYAEVSGDSDAGSGPNLKTHVMDDVIFTPSQTNNYAKRLANLDRFQGLVDETDEDSFVDLAGEVERTAAALKQTHRDMLLEKLYKREITDDQINNAMKGDAWYAEKAYKLWSEGGGLDESTKLGFGINGADILLRGDINTADIQTLQENMLLNRRKDLALDAARTRQGEFYPGDERTNQFRLKALRDTEGAEIFRDMPESNEEFEAMLTERGFTFDDNVRDWHYSNWDILRENPGAAQVWFINSDNEDLRSAATAKYLDTLLDSNDIAGWAYAQSLWDYLDRMRSDASTARGAAGPSFLPGPRK